MAEAASDGEAAPADSEAPTRGAVRSYGMDEEYVRRLEVEPGRLRVSG